MASDRQEKLEKLSQAIGDMKSAEDADEIERLADEHLREHPEDTITVGSMMEMIVMLKGAYAITGSRPEDVELEEK